jgi:ABC-type dipeptide/oligopeptide/nickel transport system permease subunit
MSAPIDVPPSSSSRVAAEDVLAGGGIKKIEGRSLGEIAWTRFKRDKVAVTGGIVVIFLLLVGIAAAVMNSLGIINPDGFNSNLIDPLFSRPIGALGGISWAHPLGVEPINGRDLLARTMVGATNSLLIALLATLLSVVIGVVLGLLAGYAGGWIDTLISRIMDVFLAFPILLFAISLTGVVQNSAFGLSGYWLHVAVLAFVIGFFNWPYIGRIIRGQTLSLREREFVDAARSMGGRTGYILFRELLPNLVAPILVYSTLLIPTNILFEAALSFLGVGFHPPTASWGGMLSQAVSLYQVDPEFMLVPGVAIFITVMAFNLLGDGLRDALDPRSR